jgi:hypothetical protein
VNFRFSRFSPENGRSAFGQPRPFRVRIGPMHDGTEEVYDHGDKISTAFFQRIGFDDLLHPASE